MRELSFSDLSIGLTVVDPDGIVGVVTECYDIHNIIVDFKNFGSSIYCLDKNCLERHNSERLYG